MMKRVQLLKTEMIRGFMYRFDVFLGLLYPAIRFFVQFSFWTYIYNTNNNADVLFGFDRRTMVSYFFIGYIITLFNKSDAMTLGNEIKDGKIDRDLLKPINYIWYRFMRNIGNKIFPVMLLIPFIVFFSLVFPNYVFFNVSVNSMILFFLFLLMGFIINFFIDFIIGTTAFVFDDVWAISASINHIKRFVAGEFLPLSILPNILTMWLSYLPFQYIIYYPALILVKQINRYELTKNLLIGVLWTFLLYIITIFVWRKMIRKFSAFGG
ncbi:MAG: ABC-2 family transporter protein [Clostridium sp.]|jgi:ABC-2 type transport system permease protein|nr:ABC-2 family transporter protein [Clostridium sp.]